MSALEELRDGNAGPDFVNLLQRTIRAVAVARNFPAPDGFQQWDAAAITSTAGDFLASPRTPRRLTDLVTFCQTEDGLRRRLQRTVANFLADHGRRTPVGRLVLRVNEVLGRDESFEQLGGRWGLVGGSVEPAAVDLDVLVAAASKLQVVVPPTWRVGTRKSPDIAAASVVDLARMVVEVAGGPVTASIIAQVAARRLGLGAAPLSLEAKAFDPPQPSMAAMRNTSDAILVEIRAHEVFSLLNDTERIAIGRPEFPTSELGPFLGVSKATAANIRKRAVTILRDELDDDDDGQAVADFLLDLARNWTNSWTDSSHAT